MAKFDVDEFAKNILDSIEFVLEGKTYSVKKITAEMLDELNAGDDDAKTTIVYDQLASITGEPVEVFVGIDLRKLTAVIRFVSDEIIKQLGADPKNPGKTEVAMKQ